MELKINKISNGYSVVMYKGYDKSTISGKNYLLNNTDEVLGRAVSLIIDFFREDKQEEKPKVWVIWWLGWLRMCEAIKLLMNAGIVSTCSQSPSLAQKEEHIPDVRKMVRELRGRNK